MKTNLKNIVLAATAGLAVLAAPAIAQNAELVPASVVKDVGAQERINFSGKLRMLSQRIPSAACHLAEGVEPESSSKLLASAATEFDKILNALEFGDEDLSIIGAEERRKTLKMIHALHDVWDPMKTAADRMAAGDISEEDLNFILDQNMAVLGAAKLLVSELVAQYSDPVAMVQADSMTIDIAGRQRMLTQKMSKESCMLRSAHAQDDTAQQLQGTMQMFEVSLEALRNGMPDAGIRRPHSPAIAAGLDGVHAEWSGVKPALQAILSGMEVDDNIEVGKFNALNTTMKKMNEVVGMYTKATKHDL